NRTNADARQHARYGPAGLPNGVAPHGIDESQDQGDQHAEEHRLDASDLALGSDRGVFADHHATQSPRQEGRPAAADGAVENERTKGHQDLTTQPLSFPGSARERETYRSALST